jgi:hypothetical protein
VKVVVLSKVGEISVEDCSGNVTVGLDAVCLLGHGKVGEFVCALHVVGLETGIETVLGPGATA